MEDEQIQIILVMLKQMAASKRFSEEAFTEEVLAVGSHLENAERNLAADIALAKLYSKIEDEFKKLKVSQEEKKALAPLKMPKVHRLYVDGVFDLTHSGHFNAIRQARQLCEVLVLGVVSTEEVIKRKGPPVLTYEERAGIARACKWVDEVYDNAPYDPTLELLDQLNCSHVAHGDDSILLPDGTNSYQAFINANRFLTFKRTEGISTTDIVGRLLLLTKQEPNTTLQNIRKLSGDGTHVIASKIKEIEETQEKQEQTTKQTEYEIDEKTAHKVKLLNTTRRIRQFSHGLKEAKQGDKIIYIDGSYDMIHIGHISTLANAKKQGDYLIVGLHDDDVITEKKGRHYPLLSLQERVLSVLAIRHVDEVVIGAPWKVTKAMIDQFKIDLVVSGSIDKHEFPIDHADEDAYQIPKQMDKFAVIQSTYELTTDKIIERILHNRTNFLKIYNVKNKKQDEYFKQKEELGETVQEI